MSVSPFRSGAVVFGLFSSATNLDRKARWGAEMCGAAVNERKHRTHLSLLMDL